MLQNGIVTLAAVTFGGMLLLLLISLLSRRKRPRSRRLREADDAAKPDVAWEGLKETAVKWLPSLGDPLAPKDQKDRGRWQDRLTRAGVHDPRALAVLSGVKAFLILLGPGAFVLGLVGGLSAGLSLLAGATVTGLGLVLPGLWLDWRAARRQTLLNRGLPDALDMLVMCVEGGLSLSASLSRVRAELQTAHPELAAELSVAEREMMVGLSAGEALRNAGKRVGLEDLSSLASVLLQSQRYGASVAKAMRTYADALRNERRLSIEEKAQKAAVKILFPTLLCIFPAIFVVVLGPAAYQIHVIFSHMK
jgi:tight adherence protein C